MNSRFQRFGIPLPPGAPSPPRPPFAGPVDDEEHGFHGHRGGRRGRRGGGPRFGPGFGPGGPRGPFPPFPGGHRGRGRRTARGDIRAAVLSLLAEGPRHGYEIIQEITDRSEGAWSPSPGSVYPTLALLERDGLAVVEKGDGRRIARLTDAGTTYVEEHRAELAAVWESIDKPDDDSAAVELWEQLGQLNAAAQQVLGAGTPEQVSTATEAITTARKSIYRLLAE